MSLRYSPQVPSGGQPQPVVHTQQQQLPPPPYESTYPPIQNLSLGHEQSIRDPVPHSVDHGAHRGPKPPSTPPSDPSFSRSGPRASTRPSAGTEDDTDDREKIHIAVMGVTGSGKSNFIQLCTQSKTVKVGHGLRSCTNEVGEHEFIWRDKHIYLIDTPGFDDTRRTDREVLDDIAAWLGTAYQAKIELTGILYFQRITDPRISGVAFDNLKMFKKLCGKNYYPRVTLATTMWDIVKEETAEAREAELLTEDDFWRDMKQNGCRVDRHYGDRESAMDILRGIIKSRHNTDAPTFVQVQKEMVDDKLSLEDTSAGKQVNAKIEEERIKLQKEWERVKNEMEESRKEHDEHMSNLYKKKQEQLEMKLAQGYEDQEKMKVELSQIQENQARRLEEVERELQRTRAELQDSRDELERKRAEADRFDPNDPRALTLKREIAQTEHQLDDADEELAAQEEFVNKKMKWYSRLGRWAKENPNTVKTAGAVLLQIASEATRRINQHRNAAASSSVDEASPNSAYQQPSQRHGPDFEIEEVESDVEDERSLPSYVKPFLTSTHYNLRGSFHDP